MLWTQRIDMGLLDRFVTKTIRMWNTQQIARRTLNTWYVDLSQHVVISIDCHVDTLNTWLLTLAITWNTHTWSITIATDNLEAIYVKGMSTLLDFLLKV